MKGFLKGLYQMFNPMMHISMSLRLQMEECYGSQILMQDMHKLVQKQLLKYMKIKSILGMMQAGLKIERFLINNLLIFTKFI